MATGVKPRDEENSLTRSDLEAIQDAMKHKKFRDLFSEYCEEMTDPANQEIYQKEMTQLEKERGYDVKFLNPKGNYVIKTSVAGDRKAFINICSNENVAKPTYKVSVVDGRRGMDWQIPYSMTPPREDYNTKKKEKCVIYDVMYHPDTLRMAGVNKEFRELVNKTAIDGLQKTYNIHFDNNNCRFPKSYYKGMKVPSVIRKEDPNYKPPDEEETENYSPELLEKLYPQRSYQQQECSRSNEQHPVQETTSKQKTVPQKVEKDWPQCPPPQQNRKVRRGKEEFTHVSENGYTIPKYVIKQQKAVELQDYTYHKDSKQYSAIPSSIVIEVNLPMLSSTKDCILDVKEKSLSLKSEKPAKYKLNIPLPYSVNDECGNAKFDKTRRMLIVTLPVIRRNLPSDNTKSLRADSGLESEENLSSQSEDENPKENLVVELSSTPAQPPLVAVEVNTCKTNDSFLDTSLAYMLPSYTHNVLDDIAAFTFHVKNTEPDSVKVRKDGNKVCIKFTSVGSGFVPIHYAAIIEFEDNVAFKNVTGEAWDNNVILQLELISDIPQKFQIGLSSESMVNDCFDVSQIKKPKKAETDDNCQKEEEAPLPVVEVTNLGNETNIVVSSNNTELDEDDFESPPPKVEDDDIVFTESSTFKNGAKSIIRKSNSYGRSFSESSVGDVASSMDYISSDCIPEESSLKKTVRFSDVIARQFYRYNSSIEGQKKKNQRKKSKKRNQDRRRSESEAEDDISDLSNTSTPRLKSALKQRRDSGMADTSDAEIDYKNTPPIYELAYNPRNDNDKHSHNNNNKNGNCSHESNSLLNIVDNEETMNETAENIIWESDENKSDSNKTKVEPITCDNIQHNTTLYNPDRLNKGQYLEVKFKNDLIFDLDM